MQHANSSFERTLPRNLRNIQFAEDYERKQLPGMVEAIGWALVAFFFVVLMLGFLGL